MQTNCCSDRGHAYLARESDRACPRAQGLKGSRVARAGDTVGLVEMMEEIGARLLAQSTASEHCFS
jgi:hypothetical protein